MTINRQYERILFGSVLFPMTNAMFNRRGILARYRQLLKTQFASSDELHEIQFRQMKSVLNHAGSWVPYYKEVFRKIGFDPGDFKNMEDLRGIPPLTRKAVVERRMDLVDTRCRSAAEQADRARRAPGEPLAFPGFRRNQLVRNTSSGSTGAPVVFYENGSITAANWANELRLRSWFGVLPGSREARMARITADYVRNSKTVALRRWLWNQLLLPGISLTEEDYALCARELAQFQPEVLWGFTSALTGLAEYLKKSGTPEATAKLRLTINWAAPLYEHERAILEGQLRCGITNIYGMREVGHIAALCEQKALHVNQESLYLETDDPAPGGNGAEERSFELLATTLTPTPMPFIRYRTGDLGILAGAHCSCGRQLQVIKELTGRTGEIFITSNGRMIAPNFWCRTFMDPKLGTAIHRFQVIYHAGDRIVIRLVRGEGFTEATERYLRSTVTKNLYESARVDFEYPERVEAQISGKYQMVLNETARTNSQKEI